MRISKKSLLNLHIHTPGMSADGCDFAICLPAPPWQWIFICAEHQGPVSRRVRLITFAASRDGVEINSLHCDNVEWGVDAVTQHEKTVCEHMKVHYKKSQYMTRHQEKGKIHTCAININKSSTAQLTPGSWASLFFWRFGTEVCNDDASGFAGGGLKKTVQFSNCFPPPQLLICETTTSWQNDNCLLISFALLTPNQRDCSKGSQWWHLFSK